MTLPVTADPGITLVNGASPSTTSLSIKSGAALHTTVWLKGITDGGKYEVLELNFTVCGFESLWSYETKLQDHFYWYNLANPVQSFEWPTLNSFFGYLSTSRSRDSCNIPALQLYTDASLTTPWVFNPANPTVQLETFANGTQRINVYQSTKFTEINLWLGKKTLGGLQASVKFAFEVCGLETVSLSSPSALINATYTRYSGTEGRKEISMADYMGNFTSSSRLCTSQMFELLKFNNITGNYDAYKTY